MRDFYLSYNSLTGHLPSNLNFTLAENYCINANMLSGKLEIVVGSNVVLLCVDGNKFSSSIPNAVCSSTKYLLELALDHNQFTNTIPNCLQSVTTMTFLDMSNNVLTGAIPTSFSNLQQIVTIIVSGNYLSGQLTSVFTNNMTFLRTIDISNNGFSGPLPYELFKNPSLLI